MLIQAFLNHFKPVMANIEKIAKKGLQTTFKQMYAVICNVFHWLTYEQSYVYNQNMSLFGIYAAPKSLQKTPLWIIMRTLLVGQLRGGG